MLSLHRRHGFHGLHGQSFWFFVARLIVDFWVGFPVLFVSGLKSLRPQGSRSIRNFYTTVLRICPSLLKVLGLCLDYSNQTLTTFYEMEHHLDHLSENQYLEAFNIMEQEPPFAHEPRNFFEMAFFNEEIYRADRLKMQHEADQKRWERLVELGVVSTEGDDIFDWEDVDSRL